MIKVRNTNVMRTILFLFFSAFLVACGDDEIDPCADLREKMEADRPSFEQKLAYEDEIRDEALAEPGLSVAAIEDIWKSSNNRKAAIRNAWNSKYGSYYKDCDRNAKPL